eukprot:365091-Chlamydomonas_euryale.AAC.12
MYNAQDVTNMFSDLAGETRALVDREIQHAYHTNALLVKMLLSQAQAAGASLLVDTNALENEFLLKQMAATEVAALSRCGLWGARQGDREGRAWGWDRVTRAGIMRARAGENDVTKGVVGWQGRRRRQHLLRRCLHPSF